MNLSSKSDINQDLFSTHLTLSLKSLVANGLDYGPGNFEVSLRNLDANVLADINKQASTMQNGSDAERQAAMMTVLPQLPKLFNKGAELELSTFNFKFPEGKVEANLLISLPKGDNANPFELMQKIQGTAKLRMPQALLKQLVQKTLRQKLSKQPDMHMQQALIQQLQTQQNGQAAATAQPAAPTPEQLADLQASKQIEHMQESGLIVVDGSDYVVDLKLDQGKLIVNGKPFDPSMMK